MLADLAAVRERVHKRIRVRELAAFCKLEQMRRVRMLEKQAAWKREGDFNRNEIIAADYDRNLFIFGYTTTLDGRPPLKKNSLWV